MPTEAPEIPSSAQFEDLVVREHSTTGTDDDGDDRDDEHADENEAPVRDVDENTETPEEFEIDDEDEHEDALGHAEDEDATEA
jgi:hypothetical protein